MSVAWQHPTYLNRRQFNSLSSNSHQQHQDGEPDISRLSHARTVTGSYRLCEKGNTAKARKTWKLIQITDRRAREGSRAPQICSASHWTSQDLYMLQKAADRAPIENLEDGLHGSGNPEHRHSVQALSY